MTGVSLLIFCFKYCIKLTFRLYHYFHFYFFSRWYMCKAKFNKLNWTWTQLDDFSFQTTRHYTAHTSYYKYLVNLNLISDEAHKKLVPKINWLYFSKCFRGYRRRPMFIKIAKEIEFQPRQSSVQQFNLPTFKIERNLYEKKLLVYWSLITPNQNLTQTNTLPLGGSQLLFFSLTPTNCSINTEAQSTS